MQGKVLAAGLGACPAQTFVEFLHIHAQAAQQLGKLARGLAGGDGLLQGIGQGFNFHGFRELDDRARQQVNGLIRLVRIVEPGGKDVGQRLHHFIGVARDGIQLAGLVVQLFHAHAGVPGVLLQERKVAPQLLGLLHQFAALADHRAQCIAGQRAQGYIECLCALAAVLHALARAFGVFLKVFSGTGCSIHNVLCVRQSRTEIIGFFCVFLDRGLKAQHAFFQLQSLAAGLAVFIGQALVFPLTVGKLILLVHDRGVEDIQLFLRSLDALCGRFDLPLFSIFPRFFQCVICFGHGFRGIFSHALHHVFDLIQRLLHTADVKLQAEDDAIIRSCCRHTYPSLPWPRRIRPHNLPGPAPQRV